MSIGIIAADRWIPACQAAKHDAANLPCSDAGAGFGARVEAGPGLVAAATAAQTPLLLDSNGAGFAFVRNPPGSDSLQPAHEAAGARLCSHFTKPIDVATGGLDWSLTWQCLQATTWIKAVWDKGHARELQLLGVPNVVHLQAAARHHSYDTSPIDPTHQRPTVSIIAGVESTCFTGAGQLTQDGLLAGQLVLAGQRELGPSTDFFDLYHKRYRLSDVIGAGEDPAVAGTKAQSYFSAKSVYRAARSIQHRDRYAVLLKRQLGDGCLLAGDGWNAMYKLPTTPAPADDDARINHYRSVAINVCLGSGCADTSLDPQAFDIAAAGGFLLCHDCPELAGCFDVGTDCASFATEEELLDKIRYYLTHPEDRVATAAAGQRRALAEHLYSHRLTRVLDTVAPKPPPVTFATSSGWDDMQQLAPEPHIVLDCGAHIGQSAATFRRMYPAAEIYAFEPVGALFEQLAQRCQQIGAHAIRKAVGDRNGAATINLTASDFSNSLLGYQEGNPCNKYHREVGSEQVEVCTLDRWCDQAGVDPTKVGVMKLDLQGAELMALRGAARLLEHARAVFLEVSFVPLYKDAPLFDEVDRFMTDRGFRRHGVYPSDQPHNWGDALYVR